MGSKVLKWVGTILVALVVLIAVFATMVYFSTEKRLNQRMNIEVADIAIPSDSASLARGLHLAITRGCMECHGQGFVGKAVVENTPLGSVYAPNLTSHSGGVTEGFTDRDYIRAIRHGLAKDGRPLVIMPSRDYFPMSDADLGCLIAYLKSLPPSDNQVPPNKLTFLARALFFANKLPILEAEAIDHAAERPASPEPGLTYEYGEYMATTCTGCHGPNLSGGRIASGPPDWPPAMNLTPDAETGLAGWTEADFIKALKEGVRPDGSTINPIMPWKQFGQMTDVELGALWMYISHLPPTKYATR